MSAKFKSEEGIKKAILTSSLERRKEDFALLKYYIENSNLQPSVLIFLAEKLMKDEIEKINIEIEELKGKNGSIQNS